MQSQINKRFLTLGLVATLFVGAIATGVFGWSTMPVVNAQAQTPASPLARTITVVGEGKVSIEPDTARATIGVETVSPTVQEASTENRTTLEAVLAALQEQGIAEEDIQTSGFSIYAERYGPEGPLPEDQVNYRVSNNVLVIIRDLDTVGEVLDAAVNAGANNIYGVEFSLDDPSIVESDARSQAIEDAKAKAEDLASLTGVTVGGVVSVSEVIGGTGGFYAGNFSEVSRGLGGGGGAPIAPGQLELVMQLQVVYEITQ